MNIGSLLCKMGFHKSEPVIADEESDDIENQQTTEPVYKVQRREVRCVRCGLVYTEVINLGYLQGPH